MQHAELQSALPDHNPHRCPWWLGWALASPVRRLLENPQTLLGPLIEPGHRVLEIGPAMGFYTPTIAKCVGDEGRVYCVDVQPRMLQSLRARLARRGLGGRVETRVCTETDLTIADLHASIDVAILIHVLHEMQDPRGALRAIAQSLRPNGKLLLIEPAGHVSSKLFDAELSAAVAVGLVPTQAAIQGCGRKALARILSPDQSYETDAP